MEIIAGILTGIFVILIGILHTSGKISKKLDSIDHSLSKIAYSLENTNE